MIMVLVSDGTSYLLGYSDQRKMHAVFKLSEIFSFTIWPTPLAMPGTPTGATDILRNYLRGAQGVRLP